MTRRFQFSLRALLAGMASSALLAWLLSFVSSEWRPLACSIMLAACLYTIPYFLLAGLAVLAINHNDD